MSEYDNNNSGALFKNDKEGNDKRPDYKGKSEVAGVQYYVSAWIRQSKAGKTYMSLKYEPVDAAQAPAPAAAPAQSSGGDDFDDDIPF